MDIPLRDLLDPNSPHYDVYHPRAAGLFVLMARQQFDPGVQEARKRVAQKVSASSYSNWPALERLPGEWEKAEQLARDVLDRYDTFFDEKGNLRPECLEDYLKEAGKEGYKGPKENLNEGKYVTTPSHEDDRDTRGTGSSEGSDATVPVRQEDPA